MSIGKKRLRVIAGPNGSGKSTLTDIIFDNSGSEPKMVAQKENGILKSLGDYIPVWYQEYVLNKL